jgi:hypothetical protein
MDQITLRKVVWEEMLFAEMRSNYFAELVRSYQMKDRVLRVCVLLASSGSVATALAAWPTVWKLSAPVLATLGSFWLLLSQYGPFARDAADLHAGWSQIARDYEALWNSLADANAEATYHQIYERAEALSRSGVKFPNKKDRLEFWMDQAAALARSRYA